MRRRLALLAAATLAVTETYRRGYTAPLIYGCRRWAAALDLRTINEPDYLA